MTPSQKQLERFMRESNAIEGECDLTLDTPVRCMYRPSIGALNPGDMEGANFMLSLKVITKEDLFKLHTILAQGRENDPEYNGKDWVGKYRDCNVRVGKWLAPDFNLVSELMNNYLLDLPEMSSFDAHHKFQKIHCWRDLNGRTGRLIWLWKAIREGYDFSISFLHMQYYQGLKNYS